MSSLQEHDGNDMWRVLLPREIHETGPNAICDIAEFDSVDSYGTTPEDLIPHIEQYDAIILRRAQLNADVIDAAQNLKVISKHGVGLDNVNIDAATDHGIAVCNTPNANARTVAEAAITHLLATRRNLVQADTLVRNENWNERSDWERFCHHTIEEETLGLFGFGNTAQETAKMAHGLGMECVAYDPYLKDSDFPKRVTRISGTETLFDVSDAVSVHTPLTNETYRSIGLKELRKIDYIVNTARGGIIDMKALLTALDNDDLLAAGIDVLEEEPPSEDDPLLQRDDVILSPHIGAQSVESAINMSTSAAANVRIVYDGEFPESTVNKELLTEI